MLSNTIKQKRKEKAGKWEVPLPKVRPMAEEEIFRVMKSGKRMKKSWKRVITKATFVGEGFTRKPPKYERFIRPSGMRFIQVQRNMPGMLGRLNEVFARRGVNIAAQFYQTDGEIGYVVLDAEASDDQSTAIVADIRADQGTIRARVLNGED